MCYDNKMEDAILNFAAQLSWEPEIKNGDKLKLADKLEVGTVQINNKPQRGPDHFPFLGIKDSGVGVQGAKYALQSMTRLKPVVINKPE